MYFLTIQESRVEAGEAQRRPGVHVDSAGKVIVRRKKKENEISASVIGNEGNGDADTYRYHPWGGGCAHQVGDYKLMRTNPLRDVDAVGGRSTDDDDW